MISLGFDFSTTVLCHGLFETFLFVNKWLPTVANNIDGVQNGSITGGELLTIQDLVLNGQGTQFTTTQPCIGITTHEVSPIHWNLIGDAGDSDVPQFMEDAKNTFESTANVLSTVADILPNFLKKRKRKLRRASTELLEAKRWIESSESGWMHVIGASNGGYWVETVTIIEANPYEPCMSDGECGSGYNCIDNWCIPSGADPCDGTTEPIEIIVKDWVSNPHSPNDGVVLVSSQHIPGELSTYPVPGRSHFNQSNAPEVHAAIQDAMSENSPDPVFYFDNCDFN